MFHVIADDQQTRFSVHRHFEHTSGLDMLLLITKDSVRHQADVGVK